MATSDNGTHDKAQTGAPMRLRVSEHHVPSSYANAFRSSASAEEVVIEFGVDLVTRPPRNEGSDEDRAGEIVFEVNNRLIMNYYTAKRLAIVLGQLLNKHEGQFGEVKLDVTQRLRSEAA